MKKKEIIKEHTQETAISTHLDPVGDIMGFDEGLHEGELIIPRCKVMQPTSPELVDNQNIRPGQLVNSITLDQVKPTFIPILKQSTWIRFNARSQDDPGYNSDYPPGSIIWRSNDPNSDLVRSEGQFADDGTPPLATKFLNIFALFEGQTMPLVISFAKTSFKAGRQLLTLARFSGEKAFFSRKYELTTKGEHDPKSGGNYYVLVVKQVGKVTEKEYQSCLDIYKTLTQKTVKIHDEESAEDDGSSF